MNGVDNADQLRYYYSTQRVHYKNWKPLWHFLLNIIIVNYYKIHHYIPKRWNKSWIQYSQREFRARLVNQLFEHSERLSGKPSLIRASLSSRVHPAVDRDHGGLERMDRKSKNCVICLAVGRKVSKSRSIRKPLSNLSANTVRPRDSYQRKRRERVPRTIFGCRLCNIYIYNHIVCWKEHIAAIPIK